MDSGQTTFYTAFLIIGILVGTIIIFFIVTIIRHQRKNNALYKAKILAEITTLEKERARIAADLHDELGPVLSAAKFKINSIDIHNEEDQLQLDKANKHIDGIIGRMREISNDLLPNTLTRKGLIAAIKEAIGNMDKAGNLQIVFTHEVLPEIKESAAINLYRIVQEIIHNTVKHAHASELKIEIKSANGMLVILTRDNGKGFDYNNAVSEHSGLGMRNMLSRAEILGGEMFIESKPGKGTSYIFEIPLKPNQPL